MIGEALGRQIDREDDFVRSEIGVDIGRVPGQTMKFRKGNRAVATLAGNLDNGLECGEGHAHIGRMHGDALVADSEDGMHPIKAFDC